MILTRVDCTSCQPSPLRDLQGGCLPTLGLESPFVKRCCRAWEQHQMRFPGRFFPSVNTTQASVLQNLGGSDGTGGGNTSQLSTWGLAHSRYSTDFAALHSGTSTALEGKGPELWFFCSVIDQLPGKGAMKGKSHSVNDPRIYNPQRPRLLCSPD